MIKAKLTSDPRTYNLPTGTDVAVIMPTENDSASKRDVVVYKNSSYHPHGHSVMRMSECHQMYDPMMYGLMFSHGDTGWDLKTPTTMMKYYAYRLMIHSGTFNTIQRCGRLYQQYIVDMYAKIEGSRLQYIKYNQSNLRADLYQGLADAVNSDDASVDGATIGKRVILPSSFVGSPRYQHQLYQDAMSIVRRYGKPDLFITFTCNPK